MTKMVVYYLRSGFKKPECQAVWASSGSEKEGREVHREASFTRRSYVVKEVVVMDL